VNFAVIILSCTLAIATCETGQNNTTTYRQEAAVKDSITIEFDRDIKPIFGQNCSPCHFPGGKMHGKLPFDRDTTIINHAASILKRIKNEPENSLLKEFIIQKKNGLPAESHN
jgi:hypothetical protein